MAKWLKLRRVLFLFSSRRRHTRCLSDWSSDVCSSDLVSQAAPRRQHAGLARRRQLLDRGKAPQEFVVVLDHRRHPRLLQHDLGKPHAIRIAAGAPRQIAPVSVIPSQKASAKPPLLGIGKPAEDGWLLHGSLAAFYSVLWK